MVRDSNTGGGVVSFHALSNTLRDQHPSGWVDGAGRTDGGADGGRRGGGGGQGGGGSEGNQLLLLPSVRGLHRP